jgi:hypothetical protein
MSESVAKKIGIPTLVIASALALAVLSTSMVTPVSAKIQEVVVEERCENPAGQEPGGQQPQCKGEGQEQITVTENQNPSGAAPPGQNK